MHKKRQYALGRPAAMTRIGARRVHSVRVRGGNVKQRAIRLDKGLYSWGSEAVARGTRIIEVVYNASNNELVRTNTLVKGAIVSVDATPFTDWYKTYYGVALGKHSHARPELTAEQKEKKTKYDAAKQAARDDFKKRVEAKGHKLPKVFADAKPTQAELDAKRAERAQQQVIDPAVAEQLKSGRVLARISSRPGQVGAAAGYILEGAELAFYQRKIQKKR